MHTHKVHRGAETEPPKLISILDICVAPISKPCVGCGQAASGAFGVPALVVSICIPSRGFPIF